MAGSSFLLHLALILPVSAATDEPTILTSSDKTCSDGKCHVGDAEARDQVALLQTMANVEHAHADGKHDPTISAHHQKMLASLEKEHVWALGQKHIAYCSCPMDTVMDNLRGFFASKNDTLSSSLDAPATSTDTKGFQSPLSFSFKWSWPWADQTHEVKQVDDVLTPHENKSDSCSSHFDGKWYQGDHNRVNGSRHCTEYSATISQSGCTIIGQSKDAWWGPDMSLKAVGNQVSIQVIPIIGAVFKGTLSDDGNMLEWSDGCTWSKANGGLLASIHAHWKSLLALTLLVGAGGALGWIYRSSP